MADIQTANEVLTRSKNLVNEANEILLNPDATADDLEKADRIKAEATELHKRYHNIMDLADIAATVERPVKEQQAEDFKRNAEFEGTDEPQFNTLGEQVVAIYKRYKLGETHPALTYVDEEGKESKDLSTGVGADGGFLVPVQQMSELLAASAETAIVRPRATVIPMARREMTMPVLDQTTTTAGQPHFFGGIQTYWQEEASQISQSDPQFRNIRLVAHSLVGYTRVSEELLADSAIGLEAFLRSNMGFAGAMTWTEEEAFINGTGAGQPLGVLNAGVTSSVARAAQTVVSYEDLLDMEAQLYSPTNNAVWMISQSQKAEIMKMTGPSGNPSYVYRPSAVAGEPATLLGRPVHFMLDHMPIRGTTTAGDVMLADWNFYLIGDRMQITVDSTDQERWRFNQVSWKVTARLDGQPWLSAALTSDDGTTSVSPFVILGAKST